ncbi:glycoside hydrolase family 95 protein, partial [bacterium]
MWTTAPATRFDESSVLGNGRLGAMVFGGVEKERVVLNESTMWSGSPQDADREDASKALPEIRRLLLAGKNAEAEELVSRTFVCKGPGSSGPRYGNYQLFGNLEIVSPASG